MLGRNPLIASLSPDSESETARRFEICYERLRELAGSYFRRESKAWTLQPTALVHEAYLRLEGGTDLAWHSRAHFLSYAARAMRQVLVDAARHKGYRKRRAPGGQLVTLLEGDVLSLPQPVDILDLDRALTRLQALDPRKASIVQMRFFAGMTVDEVGTVLETSEATIHREWRAARAWLSRALETPNEAGS